MKEIWKPITNKNLEVSNFGRVRRYLEPYTHNKGYQKVALGQTGKEYVHRLIAEGFLGPCPEGMEVHHIDANKKNNHPENLAYVTHKENQHQMMKSTCSCLGKKGAENHRARLTAMQVEDIKEAIHYQEATQVQLAKRYGVSKTLISNIINGKRWV